MTFLKEVPGPLSSDYPPPSQAVAGKASARCLGPRRLRRSSALLLPCLLVFPLAARHPYNDGSNIHGHCHDVVFENIAAHGCGDDGISWSDSLLGGKPSEPGAKGAGLDALFRLIPESHRP